MKQTLNVIPHGLIQSGTVVIDANEQTGLVDMSESIIAGWSIFNETIANSKELQLDPKYLLSANVLPGTVITVQGLELKVGQNGEVDVAYTDSDGNSMTGTATLDLSGQYIQIVHLLASGVIDSQNVTLELEPA